MRVVAWNCANGLSSPKQIEYFRSLKPDIAIIPELKQKNIEHLEPDGHVWVTNNPTASAPKGLGVLAFNGFDLHEHPRDEEMEIFIPLTVTKNTFSFNLLAVWNFYSACKAGRFKGIRGDLALEYEAIRHYHSFLSGRSLVAGDWNTGPTVSPESYWKILGLLAECGLKCLYENKHRVSACDPGPPTYRSVRGAKLHRIDHMIGSDWFQKNQGSIEIRPLSEAILSDHAPIVLEMNIAADINQLPNAS